MTAKAYIYWYYTDMEDKLSCEPCNDSVTIFITGDLGVRLAILINFKPNINK